jgi:hypothetical protein
MTSGSTAIARRPQNPRKTVRRSAGRQARVAIDE